MRWMKVHRVVAWAIPQIELSPDSLDNSSVVARPWDAQQLTGGLREAKSRLFRGHLCYPELSGRLFIFFFSGADSFVHDKVWVCQL